MKCLRTALLSCLAIAMPCISLAGPAPGGTSGQASATGRAQASVAVFGRPVPLLWKVSDADNSVYLLGSFHVLRSEDYPLSDDAEHALADSELVMFELAPDEMQSPQLPLRMRDAGLRKDGKRLQDDLDLPVWAKLQAYAQRNAMPLDAVQEFEPWYMGLMISSLEMQRDGLDPKLGLDEHFMLEAQRAGKQTQGLETGDEQIALLDGMGLAEQRQFLAEALDDADDGAKETEELHRAWREGDAQTLWNRMAVQMQREYPRLYHRIDVQRNEAWVPKIAHRLDDVHKGNTLVVVGALHLLGPDGVVEKLRAKGYKVERVCSACK